MNNIPTLLKEREMSVYRLAQIAEIDCTTLYKIAKSYPIKAHWRTMVKISKALSVKIDALED